MGIGLLSRFRCPGGAARHWEWALANSAGVDGQGESGRKRDSIVGVRIGRYLASQFMRYF